MILVTTKNNTASVNFLVQINRFAVNLKNHRKKKHFVAKKFLKKQLLNPFCKH